MTKVLDHGEVQLLDSMGDDKAIVDAARVSYGNNKKLKTNQEDRQLINYLMRHNHTSPFEMVEFKFYIKAPLFVARQLIRHRTASLNEYSGRYSKLTEECYLPDTDRICGQDKWNKQGSSKVPVEDAEIVRTDMGQEQAAAFMAYNDNLEAGVSKEISRINLPLSQYTYMYWKIDLHNLFHFLRLRMHHTAQWEIQEYAHEIFGMIRPIVPLACTAFKDYKLDSETFSGKEMALLRNVLKARASELDVYNKVGFSTGEWNEFMEKLNG